MDREFSLKVKREDWREEVVIDDNENYRAERLI